MAPNLNHLLKDTALSSDALDALRFLIHEAREKFDRAVSQWKEGYTNILEAWSAENRKAGRRPEVLNAIAYQAGELARNTVIEELASLRFLPRYGFPIGLQSLRIPGNSLGRDGGGAVKLERDGMTALGEYVPGSQLLAGGKVFSSRALARSFDKDESRKFGVTWYRFDCIAGHTFYRTESTQTGCIEGCQSPLRHSVGKPMIIPRFGYECAAWDPPSWRGSVERVGATETVSTSFADRAGLRILEGFGGLSGFKVTFCDDGTLIGANTAGRRGLGFAICTRCGYSDKERFQAKLGEKLPSGFALHTPIWKRKIGMSCWKEGKAEVLRNQSLGAQMNTDLLQLDLSAVIPTHSLGIASITLAHALRVAGAQLLVVDERDLAVLAARMGPRATPGAQLYETTPGGNGHIAALLQEPARWLEASLSLLKGNDEHQLRCREACLHCILNQHSQADYESGGLQRAETLRLLMGDRTVLDPALFSISPLASGLLSPEQRAARLRSK